MKLSVWAKKRIHRPLTFLSTLIVITSIALLVDAIYAKRVDQIEQTSRLAAILQRADLFILPSIEEGLPLAVQEAILLRVPVVATNVGGTAELLPQKLQSALVNAGDADALAAEAIRLLSSQSVRQSHVDTAFKHASATYSIESAAEQTLHAYRAALARRGATGEVSAHA